jgi:hypothetical protein
VSENVFTTDEISVDLSLDAARCQLEHLVQEGVLLGAAEYAYGVGITGLVETVGPAAGMSRLAGVRAEDIAETAEGARLWLRWEAIGLDGTVYPALDAALTLTPAGEKATLLALAGVYRLAGQTEAGLDPAIVRCFAAVAVRSFIARLACALIHPAGVALRLCVDDQAACGAARIGVALTGGPRQDLWA